MELESYLEFSSPYAYFASERIERLCAKLGLALRWRPILLGPLFQRTGQRPLLNDGVRGGYARQDCLRWARLHGIPFQLPAQFPVNSLKAARGALVLRDDPRLADYVHACFRAYWVRGQDLADDGVLGGIVESVEHDPAQFLAAIRAPAVKQHLLEETERAWARGVFGAPTFILGKEILWGNDRLPLVEALLREGREAEAASLPHPRSHLETRHGS